MYKAKIPKTDDQESVLTTQEHLRGTYKAQIPTDEKTADEKTIVVKSVSANESEETLRNTTEVAEDEIDLTTTSGDRNDDRPNRIQPKRLSIRSQISEDDMTGLPPKTFDNNIEKNHESLKSDTVNQ